MYDTDDTDIIGIIATILMLYDTDINGFIAMILMLYATDIIGIITMILILYDTDIDGFYCYDTHVLCYRYHWDYSETSEQRTHWWQDSCPL